MTVDRNNINTHADAFGAPEALPAEFEQHLVDVDRLLSRAAQLDSREAPAGFSQRVFEMSMESLANPSQRAEDASRSPRLRLVEAEAGLLIEPRRMAMWSWARLSVAAAVLLAAGIAIWNSLQPAPHPAQLAGSGGGAGVRPETTLVARAPIDLGDLDSLDAANPSALDAFANEFSYLLDAQEVRSFADLNNDLILLVQELEM